VNILNLSPRVALALYAHPDDADVAAGGTLAAWAKSGSEVHLVVLCDGSKGAHHSVENVSVLSGHRRGELDRAAALMGLASAQNLGFVDGELANNDEVRERLVGIIRQLKPEVVVAPDPTAIFFGGVYVNHRDHRETGWAVLDACAPASAMPLYYPSAGPTHQVETMLLSGSLEPDAVFNIASSLEAKIEAVLAHSSQLGGESSAIREVVVERAAQAGAAVGLNYGEAFRRIDLAN
jgi:LmbE family N-acetylglucosaminyl deacetylase